MKEFTIKDIIKYNSPCKSCGAKTQFHLLTAPGDQITTGSPLAPIPHNGLIAFNLIKKYNGWINLIVDPTNHHFAIQSNSKDPSKSFLEHIENNNLFAESNCGKCNTIITSNLLKFKEGVIKPLTLFTETVNIITSKYRYSINTYFSDSKSFIRVDILNKAASTSPLELNIPAIPLYKFKDREALLAKLKLLVTFS